MDDEDCLSLCSSETIIRCWFRVIFLMIVSYDTKNRIIVIRFFAHRLCALSTNAYVLLYLLKLRARVDRRGFGASRRVVGAGAGLRVGRLAVDWIR